MQSKTAEQEHARKLRQEGIPFKQIAKQLGVSPGSVHLWCRDIQISKRQHEKNRQRREDSFCGRCGRKLEKFIIVRGKRRKLARRKECLLCSPFRQDRSNLPRTNAERVSNSRRNRKVMAVAHMGGACRVCGYNRCVEALQFHHLDPAKKDFAISQKSYRGWKAVREELEKCVLLCNRFHTEVHAKVLDLRNYLTLDEIEKAARAAKENGPNILDFFNIPG